MIFWWKKKSVEGPAWWGGQERNGHQEVVRNWKGMCHRVTGEMSAKLQSHWKESAVASRTFSAHVSKGGISSAIGNLQEWKILREAQIPLELLEMIDSSHLVRTHSGVRDHHQVLKQSGWLLDSKLRNLTDAIQWTLMTNTSQPVILLEDLKILTWCISNNSMSMSMIKSSCHHEVNTRKILTRLEALLLIRSIAISSLPLITPSMIKDLASMIIIRIIWLMEPGTGMVKNLMEKTATGSGLELLEKKTWNQYLCKRRWNADTSSSYCN